MDTRSSLIATKKPILRLALLLKNRDFLDHAFWTKFCGVREYILVFVQQLFEQMQWRYFSSRAKKRAALLIDGDICTPKLLGSFVFEAERLYHPISKKVFIPVPFVLNFFCRQ